jgi:hypothetical protein
MNIADIKAAVDAGYPVSWVNEAYRVHKDGLGQYLITYLPNGSTIGLTDLSGTRLYGDKADFFIAGSNHSLAAGNGGSACIDRRCSRSADWTSGQGGRERKGGLGFCDPRKGSKSNPGGDDQRSGTGKLR